MCVCVCVCAGVGVVLGFTNSFFSSLCVSVFLEEFLCVGLSGFKFTGGPFSFFVYVYTCLCIYICVCVCVCVCVFSA